MGKEYENRELQKGWKSSVHCWKQTTKPSLPFAPIELVTGAAAAKAATSVTVTGMPTRGIEAGNVLLFVDADELTYLAEVTTNSTGGTLTVKALAEAIPSGAKASWPPELLDRTDAEISRPTDTTDTQTFNTGGNKLITTTVGSKSGSFPGPYLAKNGGYWTAFIAAEAKTPLWFAVQHLPPDQDLADVIETPFIAKGYITDNTTSAAADGFRQGDISVNFSGKPLSDFSIIGTP
ncbi:hypothetical protein QT972_00205 [Microcoleus sp. herbarium7]|uniref:hypothetical protein n=1 Tax=Microcoleus sp. herbarium7 TaxID=3055435 RepID=UPI002FD0599B